MNQYLVMWHDHKDHSKVFAYCLLCRWRGEVWKYDPTGNNGLTGLQLRRAFTEYSKNNHLVCEKGE